MTNNKAIPPIQHYGQILTKPNYKTNNATLECEECKHSYRSTVSLNHHIVTLHEAPAAVSCGEC